MAIVHRLSYVDEATLGRAIDAYLATLRGAEQAKAQDSQSCQATRWLSRDRGS